MGFYDPAPDARIYYDADGSIVYRQSASSGIVTYLSGHSGLNDETDGWGINTGYTDNGDTRVGVVFPNQMDVTGVFLMYYGSLASGSHGDVRTSVNTTNGVDGDWVVATTTLPVVNPYAGPTAYRTNIAAVSYLGITGITINVPGMSHIDYAAGIRVLHLYGKPSAGENPDRLRFWDPIDDFEADPEIFDFEEQQRTESSVREFRIKNDSPSWTANNIVLADSALTVASPTLASQTMFSLDETNWSATLDIGNLAFGGTLSPIVYVRLALTSTAALGLWRQRLTATATTWT